jgi:hypothetical protein
MYLDFDAAALLAQSAAEDEGNADHPGASENLPLDEIRTRSRRRHCPIAYIIGQRCAAEPKYSGMGCVRVLLGRRCPHNRAFAADHLRRY